MWTYYRSFLQHSTITLRVVLKRDNSDNINYNVCSFAYIQIINSLLTLNEYIINKINIKNNYQRGAFGGIICYRGSIWNGYLKDGVNFHIEGIKLCTLHELRIYFHLLVLSCHGTYLRFHCTCPEVQHNSTVTFQCFTKRKKKNFLHSIKL